MNEARASGPLFMRARDSGMVSPGPREARPDGDQTSDAQLRIGEYRASGSGPSDHPGM